MRFLFICLYLTLSFSPAILTAADKPHPVNKTWWKGRAIEGYDPVAYFTESQPRKGLEKFQLKHAGATWLFASSKHLELFRAAPNRYEPQYGGYCAWAVSQDSRAGIDPNSWKIVEGKLYLNYNAEIQARWEKEMQKNITQADRVWNSWIQ